MRKFPLPTLIAFFIVCTLSFVVNAEDLLDVRDTPQTPVKLIYDTDIGNDSDDALALAIIHNMIDRGKCELVGITITKTNRYAALFTKAFNIQYGHPDIPIGIVKDGLLPDDGLYARKMVEFKNPDGSLAFPIPEDWVPEDSIVLLRKLLAEAEDHSIVIVQVGFATNLARLLETPADEISPLIGRELAAKKVRLVSVMGGAFTFLNDDYKGWRSYNFINDFPAAQKFVAEWPTPIVFSGYEVGDKTYFRECTIRNDYHTPSPNILQETFYAHRIGRELLQSTWDLTSVLFVLRPEAGRDYFTLSEPGTVTLHGDGTTTFAPGSNGKHRCFITTPEQMIRVEEAFVNLCSEKH